ncbi:MAG: bifunctional (p)ppGpp synthetase/guanosine-3',5'-bis(diphosphate) 3'-pyrophosphohydrolase [Clostridiaceae bacterium]|nr:bifunctional (p)ppGpp synthetase/guanosine-3',5'-bis(diphosphate) 3'-pyrophosphohydrolase [Clostridiaceae bacterium]
METDAPTNNLDRQYAALRKQVAAYMGEDYDFTLLDKAYAMARDAHAGQLRDNGEPYMVHPLSVTEIMTTLNVDETTLVATLLHDTVEDTDLTIEQLREEFGEEVANLVDGVTKLGRVSFTSTEELQAENFRKMFLAMAQDIRVVLIKLADRLHNMRTIKYCSIEKQQAKAHETLDIYAPLADRLGIYRWKWELEDLCLRYIDRQAYYELVGAISQRRSEREEVMNEIVNALQEAVKRMGIDAQVEGRPKHFYSIYKKMRDQEKSLEQIFDLFATRIIVPTLADCYSVLGLVHEMYRPIPGRFKDYISVPKPNRYQSLHTTVIGSRGIPFEVQIRTYEMHQVAEYGIAAHWRYKAGKTNPNLRLDSTDEKLTWLRQLLEWQRDMKDDGEYLEQLREGLVANDVFVFTPKGDVLALPDGATPIDFAYSIHSDIGNRMFGAKVNGRMVPINTVLKNGDIVEILTSEKISGPSRDWLKIARSASTRNKINQWFRRQARSSNVQRGKELLDKEIQRGGFKPEDLMKEKFVRPLLTRYNFRTVDDLLAAIGYSGLTAGKAFARLRDEYIRSLPDDERRALGYHLSHTGQVVYSPVTEQVATTGEIAQPAPSSQGKWRKSRNDLGIIVKDIDNCLLRLSRCCNPVPGDPIIGYISRGRGVAVHRRDCPNIRSLLEKANKGSVEAERASRLIDVAWDGEQTGSTYQVGLRIIAHDRRHLLADVSNAISDEKTTILSGSMTSVKDVTATVNVVIEISDQNQYNRIVGRIKAIRDVIDVQRC